MACFDAIRLFAGSGLFEKCRNLLGWPCFVPFVALKWIELVGVEPADPEKLNMDE